MERFSCLLGIALSFAVLCNGVACAASTRPASHENAEEPWVELPAGARPAYMGIHGGTMPVSLLVSDDGACLLSFVGCTGNDFLEALRTNPVVSGQRAKGDISIGNASLFAGNATTSLPVIPLSGDLLSGLGPQLQPFGLSDEPLSIEGEAVRPEIFPERPPRRFSFTDWLFPTRKKVR